MNRNYTAAEAAEGIETLTPEDPGVDDVSDLAEIGRALAAIDNARDRLGAAVATARSNGRSWTLIGYRLGVSKQAARERFSEKIRLS